MLFFTYKTEKSDWCWVEYPKKNEQQEHPVNSEESSLLSGDTSLSPKFILF